jgi:hypothetical protein
MATVTISKSRYNDVLKSLSSIRQQFTGLSNTVNPPANPPIVNPPVVNPPVVNPPIVNPPIVNPPVVNPPVVNPPVVNPPVVNPSSKLLYITKRVSDLNITKTTFGSGAWNGNEVTCTYPKGSCAGNSQVKGGYGFYAVPKATDGQLIFPCNEAIFQYDVFFDPNFDWVKGGKLPGLYAGVTGADGGNHVADGMSCRLMWRAGGDAEFYLYVPDAQDPTVQNISIGNGSKGLSVGRGQFKLVKGMWQTVKIHIKLNDVGKMNGILELWSNDKLCISLNSVNFRSKDIPINGVFFNTFFGGADLSWASTVDTYTKFRNFSFYSN